MSVRAIVLSVAATPGDATIDIDIRPDTACARCRGGGGCAGLLSLGARDARRVTVRFSELEAAGWRAAVPVTGDTLTLSLAPWRVLGVPVGLWAYLLPLGGLLVGALAGAAWIDGTVSRGVDAASAGQDLATLAGAATGLLAGMLAWKSLARVRGTGRITAPACRIMRASPVDRNGLPEATPGDRSCPLPSKPWS